MKNLNYFNNIGKSDLVFTLLVSLLIISSIFMIKTSNAQNLQYSDGETKEHYYKYSLGIRNGFKEVAFRMNKNDDLAFETRFSRCHDFNMSEILIERFLKNQTNLSDI